MAKLAVYVLWVLWVCAWMVAAAFSDRARKRSPLRSQLPYRVMSVIGALLLFDIYPLHIFGPQALWRVSDGTAWILVLLIMTGLGFTVWARLHLGKFWSSDVSRKDAHRIVETGPYAYVRHPIYTGLILAVAATVIFRGTPTAIIGGALLAGGFYLKARLEEKFLRAELGTDAYGRYARKTAMLVPFIRL